MLVDTRTTTAEKFGSRDPIGYGGGINSYLYVKGNPEIQVDPSGLRWIEVPRVNASCRRYKLATGKCNYHCSCHGGTHKVNGENYRYYNRPCNDDPATLGVGCGMIGKACGAF